MAFIPIGMAIASAIAGSKGKGKKPTAAGSGAIGAAANVASSDILPAAGALQKSGMSLLDQYQAQLEGLLSTDPKMRMEANAATIADQTALAQGARQQVKNMPRGGAAAYESGLIDQNLATNIGNALSASWNQAQQELGQLAQYETTTGIQGDIQAAGLLLGAGNAYDGISSAVAAGDSATISAISQIANQIGSSMANSKGGG